MGHIANNIVAKDKKLSEVFGGTRYKIDSFQREYRWQRKQIESLISDLTISFLKNYSPNHETEDYINYDCYYMGTIVLSEEKKEVSIVDGQQRLTSFTLLLIFLKHLQLGLGILEDDSYRDIEQYLYSKIGGKKTLTLNVDSRKLIIEHLIKNPENIFDGSENIKSDYSQSKTQDESVQNIIERYEDIGLLFPEELRNLKTLPLFIEWLLEKIIMVEVKAYSMENAYTIFETMNDRGLSLNATEILKGFLLSKIEKEELSDEVNEFWKERIALIKSQTGNIEGDLDFFKAWLRAKYAETIKATIKGADKEDFEIIGTQFHTWVKSNPNKTFLNNSDDYFFFIRSDFDFFSEIYINLQRYKKKNIEGFENLYVSNFYPIADSLTYPLLLSPISKIDEEIVIDDKIKIVSNFLDAYANLRTITGRPTTQSSIRNPLYELVKSIRNSETNVLKEILSIELKKSLNLPFSTFSPFQKMDNWGYYHYFFARILFYFKIHTNDFSELLRNKKQSSFVLINFLQTEDTNLLDNENLWDKISNSVAAFCLVRRYHLDEINLKPLSEKIVFLKNQNYLPEMNDFEFNEVEEFIISRDNRIKELVDEIWNF